MNALQIKLIKELKGKDCKCGAMKKEMQTFCKRCYFSLPPKMRDRLYDRIDEGYEAAYAAACEFLFEEKERVKA